MNALAPFLCLLIVLLSAPVRADIYRWDNGQVIPGTEGLFAEAGAQLDHLHLAYAQLSNSDLPDASFDFSNLDHAKFDRSNLTNASLSGANAAEAVFGLTKLKDAKLNGAVLTGAYFYAADLGGADFSGTNIGGAAFVQADGFGFSKEQLYSTASYNAKDLNGVIFQNLDFRGVDLRSQNMAGGRFYNVNLENADLSNLKLPDGELSESTLTNADLTNANLTNARLVGTLVTNVSFDGAIIKGANFHDTRNLTNAQLYSTASYHAKELQGITLSSVTRLDFHDQNLTNARLYGEVAAGSNFQNANLTNFNTVTLRDADLQDAIIAGAILPELTSRGFTKEQLYSTASYQTRNLSGIRVQRNDFTGWNFASQYLANAWFDESNVTDADFTGADLRGASGVNLVRAIARNTIRRNGELVQLELVDGESLWVRDYDGDVVRPSPPYDITIADSMSVGEGGTLGLVLESDPWDSLVSFEPDIPVQLGGRLELAFAGDVDVSTQIGRTFHVFDWTGVDPIGAFTVSSRYDWDTSSLYVTGEVTLTAVPEPASLVLTVLTFGAAALVLAPRR